MDDSKTITISCNEGKPIVLEATNRKLNAKEIYDFLQFSRGDTYNYQVCSCSSSKDDLVLNKLHDLLKSITDQLLTIEIEESDQEMKDTFSKSITNE